MDEPTNYLSVREREHVNELAQQLRDQGLQVIYITHNIFQVHRIADRIVMFENGGKIVDAIKGAMTAEKLERTIRDGGRQVEGVEHDRGDRHDETDKLEQDRRGVLRCTNGVRSTRLYDHDER